MKNIPPNPSFLSALLSIEETEFKPSKDIPHPPVDHSDEESKIQNASDHSNPKPKILHRLFSLIKRPIHASFNWVLNHFRIMVSGESLRLQVKFSAIVAASSFLFLGVAYCYWLKNCMFMTGLFSVITTTSLFSDSLTPGSKVLCCLDRTVSTFAAFVGPIRSYLFNATPVQKFQILFLCAFSLSFLAWSRESRTQSHFVLRHTCWHIASSCCLMWLALNIPSSPIFP